MIHYFGLVICSVASICGFEAVYSAVKNRYQQLPTTNKTNKTSKTSNIHICFNLFCGFLFLFGAYDHLTKVGAA